MGAGARVTDPGPARHRRVPSDAPFIAGLIAIAFLYLALILGMLLADAHYTSLADLANDFRDPDIRF